MLFDEVVVEPETIDNQIIGPPANRITKFFEIGTQRFGDMQTGGVVVAAIKEDTLSPLGFVLREAAHQGRVTV